MFSGTLQSQLFLACRKRVLLLHPSASVFGTKLSHCCGVSSSSEVTLRLGNSLIWQGYVSGSQPATCPGCETPRVLPEGYRPVDFTPFTSQWLHQAQLCTGLSAGTGDLGQVCRAELRWTVVWFVFNCTVSLLEQMAMKHKEVTVLCCHNPTTE